MQLLPPLEFPLRTEDRYQCAHPREGAPRSSDTQGHESNLLVI